jgi:hypothetical protein
VLVYIQSDQICTRVKGTNLCSKCMSVLESQKGVCAPIKEQGAVGRPPGFPPLLPEGSPIKFESPGAKLSKAKLSKVATPR